VCQLLKHDEGHHFEIRIVGKVEGVVGYFVQVGY
jgi:hypothetical protein